MGGREGVPLLGVVNTYKSWMDASLVQLGSVSVKGVIVVDISWNLMWWVSLRSVSLKRVVRIVKARRFNFHPISADAAFAARCVMRVPCRRAILFNVAPGNFKHYYHTKVSDMDTTSPPLPRAFMEAKENDRWGKCIEGTVLRWFGGFIRLIVVCVSVVTPIIALIYTRERGRRFKFRNNGLNSAIQVDGDGTDDAIRSLICMKSYSRYFCRSNAHDLQVSVSARVTVTSVGGASHVFQRSNARLTRPFGCKDRWDGTISGLVSSRSTRDNEREGLCESDVVHPIRLPRKFSYFLFLSKEKTNKGPILYHRLQGERKNTRCSCGHGSRGRAKRIFALSRGRTSYHVIPCHVSVSRVTVPPSIYRRKD